MSFCEFVMTYYLSILEQTYSISWLKKAGCVTFFDYDRPLFRGQIIERGFQVDVYVAIGNSWLENTLKNARADYERQHGDYLKWENYLVSQIM